MASVFDFDDELDYQSDDHFSFQLKRPPMKEPPSDDGAAAPENNASTKQTSPSKPARPEPVRTVCPVLKGPRHARMKKKKAAEEAEARKKKELAAAKKREANNNKHVRKLQKKKTGNRKNDETTSHDDADEDSVTSSSVLSAPRQQQKQQPSDSKSTASTVKVSNTGTRGSIPPRRKRQRIQGATTTSNNNKGKAMATVKKAKTTVSSSSYSPPLPSEMMQESFAHQSSLSDQIKKQLASHERQQQKLVPSPTVEVKSRRRIKGAGGDSYAIQDAGQLQMLQDDIIFLSSTVLECPKPKVTTEPTVIDAVSALAVLLADPKSRRMLWQGEEGKSDSNDEESDSSLELILDVLEYTTTALMEKPCMADRWIGLNAKLQMANPKDGESGNNNAATKPHQLQQRDIVGAYYTGLLLDACSAIVSFLSWDVTIEHQCSAYQKNATGAKVLRRRILQHEGVLSAFVIICRESDPVVSNILEQVAKASTASLELIDDNEDGKVQATEETSQNQTKNMSQQSSDFSSTAASHEDADAEPAMGGDPTVAGRRKRRRKRGGNTLETIAEDGSIARSLSGAIRSPPRSPPRVVFQHPEEDGDADARTKLTFQPDDALSPSRQFSPTKRARYGDDGSSMVSCESALVKIHDKLGKARLRLAPPDQALRQSGKEKHTCQSYRELPLSFGGKDPAGSASGLALKALNRLLTGKDEGDQQSCLQDDANDEYNTSVARQPDGFGSYDENDDDPQLEEEDEALRDNPLLQTNRILENSGMVPYLARGMAETLSAIVEEVEHRESSSSCAACLRHLHDKLQGLAPIVDNACLFHDDNRIELCSASTEAAECDGILSPCGVLVGSQLLFLKVWLHKIEHAKSNDGEKVSRTSMKLLNEIGTSVLRTLTSLTHENSVAADQLGISYLKANCSDDHLASKARSWNGVEVLGHILYEAVTKNSSGAFTFNDTCTLCLNTLANLVGDETCGGVRRILADMKCPQLSSANGNRPDSFLSWLTKWLVGLTDSFRDSIMKASFGGQNTAVGSEDPMDSSGRHSGRELEQDENERLITAGNGCVLLACLLMGPPKGGLDISEKNQDESSMKDVTQKIREVILSDMPLDESSRLPSGTLFIQNTLRAFSNYLYYSMGDLSVAVVTPVRRLISELDKIKVEVVS